MAAIKPMTAQPTAAITGSLALIEKQKPPMLIVAQMVKKRLFMVFFPFISETGGM